MSRKIFIKKTCFMSYNELADISPTDTVLVNSDDFFQVYPLLVKIKADFPEVKAIYLKNAGRCYASASGHTLSSDDTIPMKVSDAKIYFANVQPFISSHTFRNFKKELDYKK